MTTKMMMMMMMRKDDRVLEYSKPAAGDFGDSDVGVNLAKRLSARTFGYRASFPLK